MVGVMHMLSSEINLFDDGLVKADYQMGQKDMKVTKCVKLVPLTLSEISPLNKNNRLTLAGVKLLSEIN